MGKGDNQKTDDEHYRVNMSHFTQTPLFQPWPVIIMVNVCWEVGSDLVGYEPRQLPNQEVQAKFRGSEGFTFPLQCSVAELGELHWNYCLLIWPNSFTLILVNIIFAPPVTGYLAKTGVQIFAHSVENSGYRPRSEEDNVIGSVHLSVRPSVRPFVRLCSKEQ